MEIKSSIILVTSAGSRLGGTIANHFVNLGATVILCDNNTQALQAAYSHCARFSASVYHYPHESNDSQAILNVFNFIQPTFNTTPDVLVNNWVSSPMPSLIGDQPVGSFINDLSNMASTLFACGHRAWELLEPERPFNWAWSSVDTSSPNASAARNTISRQEARFLKSIAGERSI